MEDLYCGWHWVDFFKSSLVRSKLCRPLGWGVSGREVSGYRTLRWSVFESGRKNKEGGSAKMQQTKAEGKEFREKEKGD